MMKRLLTSTLSLLTLVLTSGSALAHSGHVADESVHGLLHVEHIITLAVIAVAAYLIKALRNK